MLRSAILLLGVWQGLATADDHQPFDGKMSVGIAVGEGYLWGDDDEPGSTGMLWSLQMGYQISEHTILQLRGEYLSRAQYVLDDDFAQQQGLVTLGFKVYPFTKPVPDDARLDLANFFVAGGLGVGHLIQTAYETSEVRQGSWGPAASGSIGWMPMRTRHFEFGFEVAGSFAIYPGDGARFHAGAMMLLGIKL